MYRYAVFGDGVNDPNDPTTDGVRGISCNNATFLIGPRSGWDYQSSYATVFMHELGHQIDLGHNGSEDPVSMMVCGHENSTIYRSIMNYGFAGLGAVVKNRILIQDPVHGLIVADNPLDSRWRFATDDPETTQYNTYVSCYDGINLNIDWNAGEEDYQGCVSNYQYSDKQSCLDNPSSTCDCTWNEYENSLDFYSGGLELSMILGSGIKEEDQLPVIGVNGVIIAENPERMKEMGINYGKFKELEVKSLVENKKRMEEKYYTDSVVEQYNKKLIEKLRKNRTMKEGKDFEFKNGKVIFNTITGYRSFNDE